MATWERVEKSLHGLLAVVVDREKLPHERGSDALSSDTWLVLHLHRRASRSDSGSGSGSTEIQAVLQAVAWLFLEAERCRFAPHETVALWTRVLTSTMMVTPLSGEDGAIACMARSTSPLQVLVDCSGMTLSPTVMTPLRELLTVSRQEMEQHWGVHTASTSVMVTTHPRNPTVRRALSIGFQFWKCRLHAAECHLLHALLGPGLTTPVEGTDIHPSCNHGTRHDRLVAHTIARLDVSENGLHGNDLDALAEVVRTRVIRQLVLENVLAQSYSSGVVRGLRRVLMAACHSREGHHTGEGKRDDVALELSLARNSLQSAHWQSLSEALTKATRALRSLSLAHTFSRSDIEDRHRCWAWLARICFTTMPPTPRAPDCALDLSGNIFPLDVDAFHQSLAVCVSECGPTVARALTTDQCVRCQVRDTLFYLEPQQRGSANRILEYGVSYEVVAVSPDNEWWQLRVQRTGGALQLTGWVPTGAVSAIYVEQQQQQVEAAAVAMPLLAMRFTALSLDGAAATHTFVMAVLELLTTVGQRLRRLLVHWTTPIHSCLVEISQRCPHLTHLSLVGCRLHTMSRLWEPLRGGAWPYLEYLNLSANLVGAAGVEALAVLYETMPQLPLRVLVLTKNHLGAAGLGHLGRILRQNQTLELVVVDHDADETGNPGSALPYADLNALHQGELLRVVPLPRRAKLAFLSVVTPPMQIETPRLDQDTFTQTRRRYPCAASSIQAMGTDVCAMVFEFAAIRVTRRLEWRGLWQ